MSYFPIICMPYSLERAQDSLPHEIPFPGKAPIKPEGEPKKRSGAVIAIQAFTAAIVAPVIASILSISGWLLFLFAIGVIAYSAWRQRESYPDRQQAYQRQTEQYAKELPDYEREKFNYDEKQKVDAPKRIAQWRREQIQSALNETVPHDGENSSAWEGNAERVFRSHLKKYFPGKIHANLTHQIPDYSHPYTPDVAYIDLSTNLCIDIEVDEPYAYHNNKAIHYVTSEKDYKRNQFFVNRGWIVIRFSEQQVVCHPDSCCKIVAQEIAQITGDRSVMSILVNIPELPQQKQWTEAEAIQMAARKDRDNY